MAHLRTIRRSMIALPICAVALISTGTASSAPVQQLSIQSVNEAQFSAARPKGLSAAVLKAQVLLDRAGYSPGVIDARDGDTFKKALAAFQRNNGLTASGRLDQATWTRLTENAAPVLTEYVTTDADVKGPFTAKIPSKLEDMAKLDRLGYKSARELLAEKFHMDEQLLERLNRGKAFDGAGTTLVVANVEREAARQKVTKIEVDKAERSLRAFGQDGDLLGFFPASIGSRDKPAPTGTFKVRAVRDNPTYHYDPRFGFKGVKSRHKFTIAPGPNNPVGVVWIDLTAPSYGIHGTPDPSKVSKTFSHGCIRLTNWDARRLARMVAKGTTVVFLQ